MNEDDRSVRSVGSLGSLGTLNTVVGPVSTSPEDDDAENQANGDGDDGAGVGPAVTDGVANQSTNVSKAKHWCYTLNNYTEEDVSRLSDLVDVDSRVSYNIFGKEVGESGTPHLQGFISFKKRTVFTTVRTVVGQAHLSIARLIEKAIAYCKKDGDYDENGVPPKGQGARGDLEAFKEAVKSGSVKTPEDAREQFSDVYARCGRFCESYLLDKQCKPRLACHALRKWQVSMVEKLRLVADSRTVNFVVDLNGNAGKSWFANYCAMLHPDTVQILSPAKRADMAYALNIAVRVLFIDAPRSKQGEYIPYDFLEQVKDGRIFSTKYESRTKLLGPVHVVVLMNEYPDMSALSSDRYSVTEINRDLLEVDVSGETLTSLWINQDD